MNDKVKSLFFSQYLGQPVVGQECDNCNFKLTEISTIDCEVGLWGDWSGGTNPELSANDMIGIDAAWLNLRDISQLTDEECIRLATIVMENPFNRYRNIEVVRNYAITGFPYITVKHKNVRYSFEIDCTHINFSVVDMDRDIVNEVDMKPYACIDYLRSISVLLPFTYLSENNQPVTLTPAEIIALGWAKIKEA